MFHLQDMGRSLVLKYSSSFASPFSQDVHHGSMMPGVWRTISYDYDANNTMEHHDGYYYGLRYDGYEMVDDQNIGWSILLLLIIIIIIPTESNKIPSFSQQNHHFPWFLFYRFPLVFSTGSPHQSTGPKWAPPGQLGRAAAAPAAPGVAEQE